jgi:homoserine dehydrogenase
VWYQKVPVFVLLMSISLGDHVVRHSYPFDHPFCASLKGSENIISFTTKRYPLPSPLIVQGPGAGAAVTAMGVVGGRFLITIANFVFKI